MTTTSGLKRLGSKCSLVLCSPADAGSIFRLINENRGHLRQFLPWVDSVHSPEEMRAHIRVRLEDFGRREGAYFGVVADGVLQGVVSVQDVLRRHERGQLGYWLSAMACGRGIGTEAVGLAVEFGFAELGLHRLEIRCSPRNLGSRRIAEKLGFQQEGLLRDAEVLFGNYEDNIVFSMLEPEWAAMSSDRVR